MGFNSGFKVLNCVYIFHVYVFCHTKVAFGLVILNKQGWRTRERIPAGQRIFSSLRPSDRPWDTLIILFSGYWAYFQKSGRWVDHSPPRNIDVKNVWSYTSTSHITLHCGNKKNITLTLTKIACRNISLSYSKISSLLYKPHNITIDQHKL